MSAVTAPLAPVRPVELHDDPRRAPGRVMACFWCSCGRFFTATLSEIGRRGRIECPGCHASASAEVDVERALA